MRHSVHFRPYRDGDQAAVIDLWHKCELLRSWNDPEKDIRRKLASSPELFIVGIIEGQVRASAMAGYDGHRGWVNYLAVDPEMQRTGLGGRLMADVEARLLRLGCPKVNVQIRTSNLAAVDFYRKIGYRTDDVVSLGKRLIEDP